jgi:predicted DNA-binding protein
MKEEKKYTFIIPVELHKRFKKLAVDVGRSMKDMVVEDIRKRVEEHEKKTKK